jgi:predicted Zn-dependent protease
MHSRSLYSIPPLAARLAAGRPVLDRDHITALTKQILSLTTAQTVQVWVTHTVRILTRMANGHVLSGDDGDVLSIWLRTAMDDAFGDMVSISVNQIDDSVLRGVVQYCEAMNRARLRPKDPAPMPVQKQVPDPLVPVQLWHDETVRAMTTARGVVLPEILTGVARAELNASGFVGIMAQSEALVTKEGISVFSEGTDSEVTVTARSRDNRSSGWGGQATRNWARIDPAAIVAHAVEMGKRSANPVAIEPGRRTAILSPAAVAQIMRFLDQQFNAMEVYLMGSAFSTTPRRPGKLGQQVFDRRITMRSDPNDPDGGYRPYFHMGHATPAMTWVDQGVLKNLAYDVGFANEHGKRPYADQPHSIRISGGPTSIEEMIAKCDEGIYVNRFSNTSVVHQESGLTTGVTRDGCFLIKHGKIAKAVKNLRFLDSPFFMLNKLEALGPSVRAAMGYTPLRHGYSNQWPLPPIIVPPMMVHDFNFSQMSDAV